VVCAELPDFYQIIDGGTSSGYTLSQEVVQEVVQKDQFLKPWNS
jgi:hypothetical protein